MTPILYPYDGQDTADDWHPVNYDGDPEAWRDQPLITYGALAPTEAAREMKYTTEYYIEAAEQSIADTMRSETGPLMVAIAQAKALASIATSLAAIANAMHDDDDNNLTHIAHNMSYQLAVIARNAGAIDDDDDDDEPSIAEATRIVAAANRYK